MIRELDPDGIDGVLVAPRPRPRLIDAEGLDGFAQGGDGFLGFLPPVSDDERVLTPPPVLAPPAAPILPPAPAVVLSQAPVPAVVLSKALVPERPLTAPFIPADIPPDVPVPAANRQTTDAEGTPAPPPVVPPAPAAQVRASGPRFGLAAAAFVAAGGLGLVAVVALLVAIYAGASWTVADAPQVSLVPVSAVVPSPASGGVPASGVVPVSAVVSSPAPAAVPVPSPVPAAVPVPSPVPAAVPVPVRFASGSDLASPRAGFRAWYRALPEGRWVLTGHTDDRGSEAENLAIGLRRAERVRDLLVAAGADPSRVEVRSAGEGSPIADNRTPEGRRQNRRVELDVR